MRNGGRIVNVSSSVTALLQPTYGVYAAAVEAMTAVLTKEPRGRDITVNVIAPTRWRPSCSSMANRRRRSTPWRRPRRWAG